MENVPSADDDGDTEPHERVFSVFYCELQSWGPHRCKSKTLEDDNEVDYDYEQGYSSSDNFTPYECINIFSYLSIFHLFISNIAH